MTPLDTLPNKTRGARFDCPAEFAAFLRGPAAVNAYMTGDDDDDWAGATGAKTLAYSQAGDTARVSDCDRLLSIMETGADFATARSVTVAAVAGGLPNVPAMLAGSPMAMRRRQRVTDQAAPLSVVVDIGVSSSVQHGTIARRGAAALALVRLLAATRPVTLWVAVGQQCSRHSDHAQNAAFAVRLDTAPLDLSRAAWLLCAPEAFRRAAFAVSQTVAGYPTESGVNWLNNDHSKHPALLAACLPALTGTTDCLVVPNLATSGETQFDTDAAAAAWVQEQLAAHGGVMRE
jgi:hypothetical protein